MSVPFTSKPDHPILPLLRPDVAAERGEAFWIEAMRRREQAIRREQADPLRHGWEPPIWKICDALIGFPRTEPDWAVTAEKIRQRLKFRKLIKILLILGGNRSGKSEYIAKRTCQLVSWNKKKRVWMFHSTDRMSIEYQQPLIWKYLPPEIKKVIRSAVAYVSFSLKNGFSDGRLVLPTESDISFRNYEQDRNTIEGGEIDLAAPDELIPPDWLETLELRIATRGGAIVLTFTPVDGYTETVAMMCDGAETVMESVGFLLPKDGGEPDVARALGLTPEELAEITEEVEAAKRDRRPANLYTPLARPEDCLAWINDDCGDEVGIGQAPVPAGRVFETVPRVLKCADPDESRAVVHFHSSDNPYGNPLEVWRLIRGKATAYKRERFYGIANKTISGKFPKFKQAVHVVGLSRVPALRINRHLMDPAGGRNFFQLWIAATPIGDFVYREWPGPYEIPEIGVPGPWALSGGGVIDGRRRHDGRRGPGQDSLGFGYLKYKREIARLEGWHDLRADAQGEVATAKTYDERLRLARAENGTDEPIFERYIDSRPASAPKIENDRSTTALTQFEEIGLIFQPTPGDDIDEGVIDINDALDYNEEQPLSDLNRPRLHICDCCPNTIFAVQKWTGADGLKGATKDPIDLLRYYYRAGCEYLTPQQLRTTGGGSY